MRNIRKKIVGLKFNELEIIEDLGVCAKEGTKKNNIYSP